MLQSMPECTPDMSAPPPAPVVAPTATAPEPQDTGSGFAFEVHLETGQLLIDSDSFLPTTQAGLFVGHRSPSLSIGVGLDFGRVSESSSDTIMTTSNSTNMILVMPGLRFVMARSRDQRTELLGRLDIGYGRNWFSSDSTSDIPSTGHLRGQAAPGIRHWITPSFGVGGTAGLRYERFDREDSMGTSSRALSVTALFSSLELVGVF